MERGSYLLIEHGMAVHGTDGPIGTVAEVIADEEADVFRGIVISHGLLFPKRGFIAAEQIVSVSGDVAEVDISKADAENLPQPATIAGTAEAQR